ncbi:MAG TPA: hypothetical protein VM165_18105 [Planctomycetaceae bacterium]|nr:hypothetical protein [Planctomycetaceae bacterium]
MNVNITVPAEMESILRRRAAAAGQDVAAFVQQVVTEELAGETVDSGRSETHEEFRGRLRGLIQRHGIHHGRFDDSRESIYAGRGE